MIHVLVSNCAEGLVEVGISGRARCNRREITRVEAVIYRHWCESAIINFSKAQMSLGILLFTRSDT